MFQFFTKNPAQNRQNNDFFISQQIAESLADAETRLQKAELNIENESSQTQYRLMFFSVALLLSAVILGYDKWQRSQIHPHTQRIANELNDDICNLENKSVSTGFSLSSKPQ